MEGVRPGQRTPRRQRNAPALTDAIALAITSTTLGDGVKLQDNSPMEAYYCLNNASALIPDAGIPLANKPTNCNTITGAQAGQPGDYIRVDVTYDIQAPYSSTLQSGDCSTLTINKSTFMRLL